MRQSVLAMNLQTAEDFMIKCIQLYVPTYTTYTHARTHTYIHTRMPSPDASQTLLSLPGAPAACLMPPPLLSPLLWAMPA